LGPEAALVDAELPAVDRLAARRHGAVDIQPAALHRGPEVGPEDGAVGAVVEDGGQVVDRVAIAVEVEDVLEGRVKRRVELARPASLEPGRRDAFHVLVQVAAGDAERTEPSLDDRLGPGVMPDLDRKTAAEMADHPHRHIDAGEEAAAPQDDDAAAAKLAF